MPQFVQHLIARSNKGLRGSDLLHDSATQNSLRIRRLRRFTGEKSVRLVSRPRDRRQPTINTGESDRMNIYVGNLAYGVTDADLSQAFSAYGAVANSSVIKDKFSGQSKGFGFVEMPNNTEANEAIKNLNEKPLKGRNMRVNEAKPREERPDRPDRPPRRTGGYDR